jgi:cation diffusion facilitator family transporter
MEDRARLLRRASIIALVGNAILALAKLSIGSLANSLSVISDGVDSSTDVVIAIMTLFTSRIIDKPGDREHPYGHGRAETMMTTVLSFIVFFAGSQLLLRAAESLIDGEVTAMPGKIAIAVTLASIAGKLILAWTQFDLGKKTGSAMLKANGKNMSGDVVTSVSVLVGLAASYLLGLPVLDRVMAILVSLWIIKNAVGIFMGANTELMEGSDDHGPYALVFEAVASVNGAGNPHRTRIRRLGASLVVDLDIEVAPRLSVAAAHKIAAQVELAIKARLPEVYDVIVHVEPAGNLESDERYGLRPNAEELVADKAVEKAATEEEKK